MNANKIHDNCNLCKTTFTMIICIVVLSTMKFKCQNDGYYFNISQTCQIVLMRSTIVAMVTTHSSLSIASSHDEKTCNTTIMQNIKKCKTQLQNKSMKWHKKNFENLIIEWKSAKHEVFKYILVKAHTWMTMAKSIISCTSTWITLMIKTTNNGVMNVEEQNKQQWHEER